MIQTMRALRRTPALVLLSIVALLAAALLVAGCGGGSSSGGGGEPASLAPASSLVWVEADLAPEGSVSDELDELTSHVFGIESLGDFAAEELEKLGISEGEKFNVEEEVEPWLGEKVGLFLKEVHGGNITGAGIVVETSDPEEAEAFLEKMVERSKEEEEEGEFEGHKYWVNEEGSVLGVVGEYLAYGETKANFEAMVEASEGEALNEAEKFKTAMEAAPEGGVGSLYVDLGGIVESSGPISREDQTGLSVLGLEPKKATLVGTLFPHAEQVELDISTKVEKYVSGGDASKQLEALPATAVAGFATAEFGKTFGEGVNGFSEQGIPGQMEPGEFEGALEQIGVNVEALAESLGGAAVFVEGSSGADIGAAAVIESKNPTEADNTISNVGLLLRATGVEGVTAAGGGLTGFSVHSEKLGSQPLVVGSSGDKIVIAYGLKAAARALKTNAKTLGTTADFEAAKSALGSTPMSAFIDGGPGLKLVEGLLSPEDLAKFETARPYIEKISYVGVGSESKGQTTTAKLIVGLSK
jgi:Protein of unknown function (DUF3352)